MPAFTDNFPRYQSYVLKAPLYRKRKLTAVCSHQTRIGNLDAHLI
ncbi:truncated TraD [Escherichia coli]|nr:truncated TraD [Escherichia coli]